MSNTKFLFWNLNQKPLAGAVADLVEAHSVDVVVLAECAHDSVKEMQEDLNAILLNYRVGQIATGSNRATGNKLDCWLLAYRPGGRCIRVSAQRNRYRWLGLSRRFWKSFIPLTF